MECGYRASVVQMWYSYDTNGRNAYAVDSAKCDLRDKAWFSSVALISGPWLEIDDWQEDGSILEPNSLNLSTKPPGAGEPESTAVKVLFHPQFRGAFWGESNVSIAHRSIHDH